jgi:uridylate kinase
MPSKFKRVLLKLSGQIISGQEQFGFSKTAIDYLRDEMIDAHSLDLEMGIVIGGGNVFRGSEAVSDLGTDRGTADYLGMLATLFNAIILQHSIEQSGIPCRVMSSLPFPHLAEPYIMRRAQKHLSKKRIVIFACGTGNPYFTTDTAAVLKAVETNCDIVLKGTRVKGIFDSDPERNPAARFFDTVTFSFALEKGLKVMDATAFSLAMDHSLPIYVFNILQQGYLKRILSGEHVGSIVR